MGAADIRCPPAQSPELVGLVGKALAEIVHDLDDQIAAAEEQQARAPLRIAPIQPQVQPEASAIERDGAFGVGRSDHDMIESGDGRRFGGLHERRLRDASLAFDQ